MTVLFTDGDNLRGGGEGLLDWTVENKLFDRERFGKL